MLPILFLFINPDVTEQSVAISLDYIHRIILSNTHPCPIRTAIVHLQH